MAPHVGVHELIERQVRRWEAQRARREEGAVSEERQRPMITISSELGARGGALGRRLGERLGFEVYDRELIEQIAASAHVRARVVESLDEHVQNWISEYVLAQFESDLLTESDYLRHLSHVVLALGHHGHAIIVGRGAQFLLEPSLTLRVRVIAPLEHRVRCVSEDEHVDARAARRAIEHSDSERRAFIRLFFKEELTSPLHYDLVLNTRALSVAQAAEVVRAAFLVRFG